MSKKGKINCVNSLDSLSTKSGGQQSPFNEMELNTYIDELCLNDCETDYIHSLKNDEKLINKTNDCNKIDENLLNLNLYAFDFLKVVGNGNIGKVYLARQNEKLYALKCMKKQEIINNKIIKNIVTERKIMDILNSPFIIKFNGSFQDRDKVYLVLDYHNGGDLFFHLQKQSKLSEEIVKFYAVELYFALQYLHSKNIVYRDIKPENIILTDEGHLQIIDFGLAKTNISPNNLTGTLCGTNEYIRIISINLAPEAISGKKYGFNFDWWGYGVLLYELIYGMPAFYDKTKIGIYKKILHSEPNYNRTKVSEECINLLKSLLKKNVNDRINSKDIVFHPWFKNIDLNKVKTMEITPPFKPKTENKLDFSNIDRSFLNEEVPIFIPRLKFECEDKINDGI